MSWKATGWAKDIHGISRSEKLLLLVLCDYYNEEEHAAWPSTERLAKDAEMSRRHVIRLLDRLEQRGIIEIQRAGGYHKNRYSINRDMKSTLTPDVTVNCDIQMSHEPKGEPPIEDVRLNADQVINYSVNETAYRDTLQRFPGFLSGVRASKKYWREVGQHPVNVSDWTAVYRAIDRLGKSGMTLPSPGYFPALEEIGRSLASQEVIHQVRPALIYSATRRLCMEHNRSEREALCVAAEMPGEFLHNLERELAGDTGNG